jgi:rubrerythrin
MSKTSKHQNLDVSVINPQVIDAAQDYVFEPKPVSKFPCRVCGTSGASERSDGLCWVCRRLKISAWRDSDAQDAASG